MIKTAFGLAQVIVRGQYLRHRCKFVSIECAVLYDMSLITPSQSTGVLVVRGHGATVICAIAQILLNKRGVAGDKAAA